LVKNYIQWIIAALLMVMGALLLAVATGCGSDDDASAATEPTTRTFYMEAVEPKGSTSAESEPFPTDLLPAGGGYKLVEPGEDGKWVVETYTWAPDQIVVYEGDTVNLEIIGINGARHDSEIEGYVDSFVVERGKLTSLSFVADKAGVFSITCHIHPPAMTGELLVLPRP
jgi:plastocyanin